MHGIEYCYDDYIILVDILLGFLILLVFAMVLTIIMHIWVKVPYVPTPKKVVDTAIQTANLQSGDTFYDLGAGDARLLIAAKKSTPGIRAIGSELIPTFWLLGRLRILLSRQDVDLRLQNAFTMDINDADCIFLYLFPSLLEKLSLKFDKELRRGTRVLSYTFSFPEKDPVQKIPVPWITGERYLYVYEW